MHFKSMISSLLIITTATAMCRDNNVPLLVFGIADPENIVRAVKGEKIGTIVS